MAFQSPLALLHHPHLDMAANLNLDALAGALGSIIGYLGAEAAQSYLFERLLWPQISCNSTMPASLLQTAVLMSMAGSLHRAALETFGQAS
jgi:hypothetical protein